MPTGDSMGIDAKTVYAQLLAIADHARTIRQEPKTCTPLEVDSILEAYAATRSLCHEVTCGEEIRVSLPELGNITEYKDYTDFDLRTLLIKVEVECFKGVGALASIIALIAKGEVSKS
jgi:hypothetical protein